MENVLQGINRVQAIKLCTFSMTWLLVVVVVAMPFKVAHFPFYVVIITFLGPLLPAKQYEN